MSAQEPDTGAKADPEADPETDPEDDLLPELLPRLSQLSSVFNRGRLFERAMETAGITLERPALTVLITLHMAGVPMRVGEIAARMQVVGPHVTRLVNGLEQRALIRRVTDPDDQRARLIEPTPEGVSVTERYVRAMFGWFTGALADWPDQDRKDLGRLLGRFVDDLTAHLRAIDEDGPVT